MRDGDCGILERMTSPPRSVLYVPASRRKFLDKIPSLPADLVLVDLEDGDGIRIRFSARQPQKALDQLGRAARRG